MARRENFITKANGRDAALQEIYQNRQMQRDLTTSQEGNPEAIMRILAARYPSIMKDDELFEDCRYGVDERLEMGQPNTIETYLAAAADVLSDYEMVDPMANAQNIVWPGDPDPAQIQRTRDVIEEMSRTRAPKDDFED